MAYRNSHNFAHVQDCVQQLLRFLLSGTQCPDTVKKTSGEFQHALATAIILLTPMAPHFCAELWNGLAQGVQVKNCHDFDWNKSVFHQTWPEMDQNYNLRLIINKNGQLVSEIPMEVWK